MTDFFKNHFQRNNHEQSAEIVSFISTFQLLKWDTTAASGKVVHSQLGIISTTSILKTLQLCNYLTVMEYELHKNMHYSIGIASAEDR